MTAWQIPYVNLGAQFASEKDELMRRIEAVLVSGMHIGGAEVDALEAEIATYVGTRHAVALNSGTDALIFAVIAAGVEPGQELALEAARPVRAGKPRIGRAHADAWREFNWILRFTDGFAASLNKARIRAKEANVFERQLELCVTPSRRFSCFSDRDMVKRREFP